MQWTFAGSVAKTLARSPRSGNTPWLCVHTVSLPSRRGATAHQGPSEPWSGTLASPGHRSIGRVCEVAQWREGTLHVWPHSQGVFPLRGDLATVFATDPANVHC